MSLTSRSLGLGIVEICLGSGYPRMDGGEKERQCNALHGRNDSDVRKLGLNHSIWAFLGISGSIFSDSFLT